MKRVKKSYTYKEIADIIENCSISHIEDILRLIYVHHGGNLTKIGVQEMIDTIELQGHKVIKVESIAAETLVDEFIERISINPYSPYKLFAY